MLRHTKDVKGSKLNLIDGELGKIKDFYFDDQVWTIRYLVADTGKFLPGREVLISPVSLGTIDEKNKTIKVNLTKEMVERSPSVISEGSLLRRDEVILSEHYNWPMYWEEITIEVEEDIHLRSTKEVTGYRIEAIDGEIGAIGNFVIDDLSWTVRYMVVDIKKILPSRKVLLALDWIERIDEVEKKIVVNVTKDRIKSAPQYKPETSINRIIETELFDHYKKEYYWR